MRRRVYAAAESRRMATSDHGHAVVDSDERQRIVEAAWRVLARSGFQGLKVGSVVRAVPTSTRAFYRWFEDKDHLVLELMREELHGAGRRIAARTADTAHPADAVRTWIRQFVMIAADPALAARARLFSSMRTVLQRFPDQLLAAQEEVVGPLRDVIRAGADSGTFHTADPAADARATYHLCAGALSDALNEGTSEFAERASTETADFVLRALGAE